MVCLRFIVLCVVSTGIGMWSGDGSTVAAPVGPPHGAVLGKWDLPTGPKDKGEAHGGLFLPNLEHPVLQIHAILSAEPDPSDGRSGDIKGLLINPKTDKPAFHIKGVWKGPGSAKEGKWDAVILSLEDDEPVGKMGGQFTDPKPFKPGGDGKFKGVFVLED